MKSNPPHTTETMKSNPAQAMSYDTRRRLNLGLVHATRNRNRRRDTRRIWVRVLIGAAKDLAIPAVILGAVGLAYFIFA